MSAADDLYEAAAARIRRLSPEETVAAVRRGALLIDLRPTEYRWREGEVSYLFVLENSRRSIDARIRERELLADEQRARARIERAVGRSCNAPVQEVTRAR